MTAHSDEERRWLGRWIKLGEGLIVATSALGAAEYVKHDHEIAAKFPPARQGLNRRLMH